jgi:SAM-dependent methyltransferase
VESISVEQYLECPAALENQFIVRRLGSVKNRKVLDIGCGLGESSVMFARLGAQVFASDISPEMIRFTLALADRYGVKISTAVGAAEKLDLPERDFDVVYCANTLHHLTDKARFLKRVRSFLKPGGVFCSWDPVKYNPVINVYRRIAADVRTEDEKPLGVADLKLLRANFAQVEHYHFWLLTLSLFLKYFLVDKISPNQERYWKKIYAESPSTLRWWMPLQRIDQLLLGMPVLRWLSWNVVFIATR